MGSASGSGLPVPSVRERRQARRVDARERAIKVQAARSEGFGQCRDVSPEGMKLDLQIPVAVGDTISVALSADQVLHGRVAWVTGNECGIAFENAPGAALLWTGQMEQTGADAGLSSDVPVRSGEFQPGLQVKVLRASGREDRAVLRWTSESAAVVLLDR